MRSLQSLGQAWGRAFAGDRAFDAASGSRQALVLGSSVALLAMLLMPVALLVGLRAGFGPAAIFLVVLAGGGLAFAVATLAMTRFGRAAPADDRAQLNALRHLVEHVEDAVMRFSAKGEALFISRSAETLFGCRRYELTGTGLLDHVHVLDRPAYLTALSDANRSGVARKVEIRMRRDGEAAPVFFWVEIAFSPIAESVSAEGRHEVVALFRDVTERRDQENEMRLARLAAEEASEAKTRFLATMGHELRTPLNAIIGFSEMMTSNIGGELSPTHREYAELIHKSGTHLIGVVGMLLDMSRIEAGKFELNAERFDPEALVGPCLKMVEPLADEKQVCLDTRLAQPLPAIVADERACRQILINLLSNAIKFSHEGGVIGVSLKRQGNWLNLSVSDSGIGMSAEAIARVGEPFFQANDGLSRRYEGAGLGLSIVKGLVDLHQGQLRISSEAGSGTTMTVLLPINGPETNLPETALVTPLVTPVRREEAAQTVAPWPEQKRSAR
jgi:cell cycle sensor histidine kinase DivJ